MLYTNTINQHALELLKQICNHPKFNDFYLVGGTALALQIGHRISIDLDFFSTSDFNQKELKETLIREFNTQITGIENNAITGNINEIKFDFVAHQHPLLKPILDIDSIRLSAIDDIAAMKLNAIRNRGTKKDFVDVNFLLERLSIKEMLQLTNQKYPNHVDILTLKNLVYFEDAEIQPNCNMIIDVDWEDVKEKIRKEVLQLL